MDFNTIGDIVLLPVDFIIPNIRQPRKIFDQKELENLSLSIRENGLLQPITVRPTRNCNYEIIAGERRFRASIMAGINTVPSIIIESTDERSAILSLTENIQRQNLTFFEEADAINSLVRKYSYSGEKIADILGKSPSYVSNKLRLLKLSKDARNKIIEGNLTERHARALLKLDEEKDVIRVINAIVSRNMNVAQTDEFVERISDANLKKRKRKPVMLFKDVKIFINTLNHAIDTMKISGIDAKKEQFETDSYIQYKITIPKTPTSVIKSL